jgi:hypothetical protein
VIQRKRSTHGTIWKQGRHEKNNRPRRNLKSPGIGRDLREISQRHALSRLWLLNQVAFTECDMRRFKGKGSDPSGKSSLSGATSIFYRFDMISSAIT